MIPWEILYSYLKNVEHRRIDKRLYKQNYYTEKNRFDKLTSFFKGKKFSRRNCDKFFGSLQDGGLSNSSLNNYLKIVKSVARCEVYYRLITKSSFDDINSIRYWEKRRVRIIEVLTPIEIKKIIYARVTYLREQQVTTRKYRTTIYLLSLGLRISEVRNLKTVDYKGDRLTIRDGKTASSIRQIYIPKKVSVLIESLPTYPHGYLIGNSRGKIDRKTISEDIKIRAKIAGIKKRVSPHIFRHSFIMNSLDAGVPIQNVSNHVGHKNLNQLVDYLHQSLRHSKEAVSLNPVFVTNKRNKLKEDLIMKINRISDEKKLKALGYMI